MTRDDVIDMGVQAGIHREVLVLGRNLELLTDFAKLAFEKGRQQGIQQERALWELSKSTQEIGL